MDTLVPPVVAVVVTHDPGPWFEETLRSLAGQTYPELAVLVIDTGSTVDPTPRVASQLPGAFVRRLPSAPGFAAAADEALTMVEGASHLLVCHDDVALDPDAVHIMVEESFRSNAGVVAPKLVTWDDPSRLSHVGMAVDKTGAVVDRVEAGEIDHGQHDTVLDVFVAPGACTLIRADLFRELGGFDPDIVAMGEDLEFCWRAQVAGARVVVAPGARVRHLDMLASGHRGVGADGTVAAAGGVTLQMLQRRHELRAVLTCYGPFHLARVLPQVAVLSVAEVVVALAVGDRRRAEAVAGAWRWNLARLGVLLRRRRQVAQTRRLSDAEVRRMQLHGSARVTGYARRALVAGRGARSADAAMSDTWAEVEDAVGVALRPRRWQRGEGPVVYAALWVAVAVVVLLGSRQLLGGLPVVGQLVPLPSVGTMLARFFAGWQPVGVGVASAGGTGLGVLGVAGAVLVGSVGLLHTVVVLGCVPLGGLGLFRAARPIRSRRARTIATVVYVLLPVAYDAVAVGRWDGLVAYAAAPWILLVLAEASGLEPYAGAWPAGWTSALGPVVVLGLVQALVGALTPTALLLTPVMAVGLALGAPLGGGGWRAPARMLGVAVGATVVALVLMMPWSFGVLAGPDRLGVLVGPPPVPSTATSWASLLRLAVGPIGDTPLAWAPLFAAALPLVIGTGWRFAWAARAWTAAVVAWVVAWTGGRGWLGPADPSVHVLLAAAAAPLALAVGIGVVAVEEDLRGYRFGWRQVAGAMGAAGALLAVVPAAVAAPGGRWDTPSAGWGEALGWMAPRSAGDAGGAFRVLWLGDPRLLPGGSWPIGPGLSYALSDSGLPDARSLWSGSSPGAASAVASDVELACHDDTAHLGQLLAPFAVRYVVVLGSLAPQLAGYETPEATAAPSAVDQALDRQGDLQEIPGQGGYTVFANDAALAERGVLVAGPGPKSASRSASRAEGRSLPLAGWRPVLPGPPGADSYTGVVPAGTVLAASAPAGAFELDVGGRRAPSASAFGIGTSFTVSRRGVGVLSAPTSALTTTGAVVDVALWAAAGTAAWMLRRRRRRSVEVGAHRAAAAGAEPPPVDPPAPDHPPGNGTGAGTSPELTGTSGGGS